MLLGRLYKFLSPCCGAAILPNRWPSQSNNDKSFLYLVTLGEGFQKSVRSEPTLFSC